MSSFDAMQSLKQCRCQCSQGEEQGKEGRAARREPRGGVSTPKDEVATRGRKRPLAERQPASVERRIAGAGEGRKKERRAASAAKEHRRSACSSSRSRRSASGRKKPVMVSRVVQATAPAKQTTSRIVQTFIPDVGPMVLYAGRGWPAKTRCVRGAKPPPIFGRIPLLPELGASRRETSVPGENPGPVQEEEVIQGVPSGSPPDHTVIIMDVDPEDDFLGDWSPPSTPGGGIGGEEI